MVVFEQIFIVRCINYSRTLLDSFHRFCLQDSQHCTANHKLRTSGSSTSLVRRTSARLLRDHTGKIWCSPSHLVSRVFLVAGISRDN